MKQTVFAFIALGVVLFFFQNCKGTADITRAPQKVESKDIQQYMQSMMVEIEAETSDKSCTTKGECAVMPIGSKPCGGPAGFILYSPNNVDVTKLTEMVVAYSEAQKDFNKENGIISTCSIEEPPDFVCESNVCAVARP